MKPLLIFFREYDEYYFESFTRASGIHNLPTVLATFNDITITFNTEVTVVVKGHDLSDFGAVYFRTISDYHDLRLLIAHKAYEKKIPVFDPALAWPNIYNSSKAYDYLLLKERNLPIIPTVALLGSNIHASQTSNYPLIIKDAYGKQGIGAYKVENYDELLALEPKLKNNTYLLQEFIPNDGDVRILVLKNQILGAIKRSASGNEFRNNVSQGGSTIVFPTTENMNQIALESAKALGYFLAGIDLIFDQTQQQWLIMEVNRGPQFKGFAETTGIDVASEIIKAIRESY